MTATYYEKSSYGNQRFYPANDTARACCELANQKTVDRNIIKISSRLGVAWMLVVDPESKGL